MGYSYPERWVPQHIFGSPCATGIRLRGVRYPGNGEGEPVRHSEVTVKVTDGADGAVGENTYGINWHLPLEDKQKKQVGASEFAYSSAAGSQTLTTLPASITYMSKKNRSVFWTVAEGGTGVAASGAGVASELWPALVTPKIAIVAGIALTAASFAIQQGAPPQEIELSRDFTYADYCAAMDAQQSKKDGLNSSDPLVQQAAALRPDTFPVDQLDLAQQSRSAATNSQGVIDQDADIFFRDSRSTLKGGFYWKTTSSTDSWEGDFYGEDGYQRTKDYQIGGVNGHDLLPKVSL